MKALLVASKDTCTSSLREAIRRHNLDVQSISPADVTVTSAASRSLLLLFPAQDGADIDVLAAACQRIGNISERVCLVVAIAHDSQQLNTLVDAGADDFLFWPADEASLHRRLEICQTRIEKRERAAIRAQRLREAVRDAELGEQRFRHLAESSTEILTRCPRGGIRIYVSPACRDILGLGPD